MRINGRFPGDPRRLSSRTTNKLQKYRRSANRPRCPASLSASIEASTTQERFFDIPDTDCPVGTFRLPRVLPDLENGPENSPWRPSDTSRRQHGRHDFACHREQLRSLADATSTPLFWSFGEGNVLSERRSQSFRAVHSRFTFVRGLDYNAAYKWLRNRDEIAGQRIISGLQLAIRRSQRPRCENQREKSQRRGDVTPAVVNESA